MTKQDDMNGTARRGDHIVRAPRETDAMGQALRCIYSTSALPDDLRHLVGQLDTLTRH